MIGPDLKILPLHPPISHDLNADIAKALKPGMTAEAAARAVHAVLCAHAAAEGQKPEIECMVKGPADHHYAGNCWIACWEAGPYQWGIPASFAAMDAANRLVEPHYSFDLCFYEGE